MSRLKSAPEATRVARKITVVTEYLNFFVGLGILIPNKKEE